MTVVMAASLAACSGGSSGDGLSNFPELAEIAGLENVNAVALGEVVSVSDYDRVCAAGTGGQQFQDWQVDVTEWLRGGEEGEQVAVRIPTHFLRQDCEEGLPTPFTKLQEGQAYVLFLSKTPPSDAPSDYPPLGAGEFIMADQYLGAWLVDGNEIVTVDPRSTDSEQARYDEDDAVEALRE